MGSQMTDGPGPAEFSQEPGGPAPWGYGQPAPPAPGYGMPGYGVPPQGQPPPTYLLWARIAAGGGVLFNLILGLPAALVAMNHARKVRPLWESGNQPAAVIESRKARTWAIVSTVLDALGVILVIAVIAAGASASNFNTPSVVAASIKTELQKRISDPGSQYYQPGLKVTSVACKASGTSTDLCLDTFSDGQTLTETVVISSNGQSYVTR
jgi:molybdopterin/thiamine biosynthesis adenylyltransferase